MTDLKALGVRFYSALGSGDGETLMELMAPEFIGDLTPGLPLGIGRRFEGRDAMMVECWGAIVEHFDMHSDVEEIHAADNVLVAHGVYRGTARKTGKPIAARFAHFWTVADGKIVSLHQTTDSAAWHEALKA